MGAGRDISCPHRTKDMINPCLVYLHVISLVAQVGTWINIYGAGVERHTCRSHHDIAGSNPSWGKDLRAHCPFLALSLPFCQRLMPLLAVLQFLRDP